MPNNIVTQRFLACFEHLRTERKIKSARQFALSLGCLAQNFSEMQHDRRDVTIDLVRRAVELYHFNPTYIFTGEGEPLIKNSSKTDVQVLTVVTDSQNNERILHVPIPAQAGYATEIAERILQPRYPHDLPSFTLPNLRFQFGTFRSFDVAGDSMEPTLWAGDQVIGSFVEQNFWENNLKPHLLYVFVTTTHVLVKRCANTIDKDGRLVLLSDNPAYLPIVIEVQNLREVWRVVTRITTHTDKIHNDFNDLRAALDAQTQMMMDLRKMIEKR